MNFTHQLDDVNPIDVTNGIDRDKTYGKPFVFYTYVVHITSYTSDDKKIEKNPVGKWLRLIYPEAKGYLGSQMHFYRIPSVKFSNVLVRECIFFSLSQAPYSTDKNERNFILRRNTPYYIPEHNDI